jgi:hypothetical protein
MTQKELKNLSPGDIICGMSSGLGYIVTNNFGDQIIAVRTIGVMNESEWKIVQKAK